jgi:hypothetical protein
VRGRPPVRLGGRSAQLPQQRPPEGRAARFKPYHTQSLEFCRSGLRRSLKWFHGTRGKSAGALARIGRHQVSPQISDSSAASQSHGVAFTGGGPALTLPIKVSIPPLHSGGSSFAHVRPGDLLALPLRQLAQDCGYRRRQAALAPPALAGIDRQTWSPQIPDSPAGFLESWRGISTERA